jgi:hypothetical protein
MQALVPTDIDVEDKILGPFTLKQSIYLLIGGMTITLFYFIFAKISFIFFLFLSVLAGLLTFAFVFYKFNEQPFEKYLSILANFYLKPRRRIWQKTAETSDLLIEEHEQEREEIPEGLKHEAQQKSITDIDKLSYILDSRGWDKNKE